MLYFRLFCWLWGLLHFFNGVLAHSSRYNGHMNSIWPFPSILILWFLGCQCLFLPSPAWPHPVFLDSWAWHSRFLYSTFFAAADFTLVTSHIHNWASYLLWPSHFIHSGAIGNSHPLFTSSILDIFRPEGMHLLVLYLFGLLYSSWSSHGKYNGVICYSFLQWITFCQNSLLWPIHPPWETLCCIVHSFIE